MSKDIIVVVDKVIEVQPVLSTCAMASGNLIFDSTLIPRATREDGGAAILQEVVINDNSNQGAALYLLFSSTSITYGSLSGSAPSASVVTLKNGTGWIPIATSDYISIGASAKEGCVRNLGKLLQASSGCSCLYVAGLNGTGTPTYSSSGLTLKLGFLR